MTIRGRFAPTPSGRLHLGSARTALAARLACRTAGGTFVLRIEDLDHTRLRSADTTQILRDLTWLGIAWDEGPGTTDAFGPYLQSERSELYGQTLAWLRDRGLVYPCACSRKEVSEAARAPHGAEPVYPGTCARQDADEVTSRARKSGRGLAWRFRVPQEPVTLVDQIEGEWTQDVARSVGDFVVCRSDGVAAYQLAVVVDDIAMGITQVVRGVDLLESTPRQVLLYQALGAVPPEWIHVPLVVDSRGDRLSKRLGSLGIAELRERGVQPARLIRLLEESLGIEDGIFDMQRVPKRSWILDEETIQALRSA